jgi:predicted GNAT family acetyltransferase
LKKEIILNKDKNRFELQFDDGEFAFVDYRWSDGVLVLMHTKVPVNHRGKDVAENIVKFSLEYAKDNNLKIKVYCRYIETFIKRHPEYEILKKN